MEDVFFIESESSQINQIRERAEQLLTCCRNALGSLILISRWYCRESSFVGKVHIGTHYVEPGGNYAFIKLVGLPGVDCALTIDVSCSSYAFLGVPCADAEEVARRLLSVTQKKW